ncbi:MAG: helicase-related protein, partial [Spirochaetales bacterium]|nr:helicase-related protein [Spirochaetales bacterium]
MPNKTETLPDYPVKNYFPRIYKDLSRTKNIAIEAPTGSGKTTLLPILLLNSSLCQNKILLTQPRRLAAKSVAHRISSLLGSETGSIAGYRVRGEQKISPKTRIEVVTEGYALGLLQADPFLSDYDWIIIDEFHERHIETDLLLAFLLDLEKSLSEDCPGIILMTATWQGQPIEKLSNFIFHSIEGRLFPVNHIYLPNGSNTLEPLKYIKNVTQKALIETTGKVLVFLPGKREIEYCNTEIKNSINNVDISPLYGGMKLAEQEKVLNYTGTKRQIILATSIAETSLTIEGVTAVIDSGLQRLPLYNPSNGMTELVTRKLSHAVSEQRAGRAGRLGPGNYYAIWSEVENQNLIDRQPPEIISGDLSRARLQTALWGSEKLEWITSPAKGAWAQAEELLQQLEALDDEGKITSRGKVLARLPLHPRLAHMCERSGGNIKAGMIAAILSTGINKNQPTKLTSLISEIQKTKKAFEIEKEARNIIEITQNKTNQQMSASEAALLSLAYPDRIGHKRDEGLYELTSGQQIFCRSIHSEWAVFAEIAGSPQKLTGRLYEEADLNELLALHSSMKGKKELTTYNSKTGSFITTSTECFGHIVLKKLPSRAATKNESLECIKLLVRKRGIDNLPLNKKSVTLLDKLKMAEELQIEDLPSGKDEIITQSINDWLSPWLEDKLTPEVIYNALSGRLTFKQTERLDKLF